MNKILVFDHIGIVVSDIQKGEAFYTSILPIEKISDLITDKLLGVQIKFLTDSSGVCYELIAPYGEGSPVSSALKSKKNIINHVAYKSSNFEESMKDFNDKGCMLLAPPQHAVAFNNKRVCFFLTILHSVIELIES